MKYLFQNNTDDFTFLLDQLGNDVLINDSIIRAFSLMRILNKTMMIAALLPYHHLTVVILFL
ncbi:hypothetical protein J22TS3_06580 [Paenibacillus sp. J22TS3]|nr:hypothetical protein J22TS3_06580 [Paenibacillus sp. J22TS3]